MSAEEIRWGVVFPGSEWQIPTIRADAPLFHLKIGSLFGSGPLFTQFTNKMDGVKL